MLVSTLTSTARWSSYAQEHRGEAAGGDTANQTVWLTGATSAISARYGRASKGCVCGRFKSGSTVIGPERTRNRGEATFPVSEEDRLILIPCWSPILLRPFMH